MSEEVFQTWLEWIVLITSIPALINAVIFILFLRIVERKVSMMVCSVAFIVFLAMGILRIFTAYNFDNQTMRIYNGIVLTVGGLVSNIVFVWSYYRRLQEIKPMTREQKIDTEKAIFHSSVDMLAPDKITQLVYRLHPSDVSKISKMLAKIRIN